MNPFVEEIVDSLAAATGLDRQAVHGLVGVPPREEMGDYAFPCFVLAREQRRNPAELAREVADRIGTVPGVERVEAAGAYVNFRLDRPRFVQHVLTQVQEQGDAYGSRQPGAGKTLVIDFSSPNLAKPFSIAHLRSTAIGHAVYRIHRHLGWRCVGVNHPGDWGTNFGQLLAAYRKWADPEKVRADPIPELVALYTRFNQETETHPELQDEARHYVQLLESGDPETRALWSFFVEEGLKEANRIYDILGVRFDLVMGESAFADATDRVVDLFRQAGLAVESEGATVVMLDERDIEAPCMLRTSRGTSTYHSRDIAALLYRHEKFAFDKMVYVTDVSQTLHFRQVFRALELAGQEWVSRCEHAPFGLMSFKGGKMSTRRGNMVFLEDVLDQAVKLTGQIIVEKNPQLPGRDEVARQVGISAVVFADLDTRRTRNVVFDWQEVLNFDGETGPYLQYTHARFCSILRRYGRPVDAAADLSGLAHEAEMRVARQLAAYPERLEQACAESEPSIVSTYLVDLATVANKFYNELPVLSAPDPALVQSRVVLVDCARRVLRSGLSLLGMQAPEEM
ncbi:MAG: arginine--tRNA ligase [Candidatus Latescibacterota bacterium]